MGEQLIVARTKNFSIETDPKLACTCGHPFCDRRSVSQYALNKVQSMRDDLGLPMTINSGGRCPYHPDEVDKGEPGDHTRCGTVDVACKSKSRETKLKVLAGRHGATRVAGGAYCGFVHMCFDEIDRRDVPTWSYK